MVITRRLCSFGLALVIAASSLFPAAAWSKDSFISGGEEYQSTSDAALSDDLPVPDVYASPRCAPGMFKVSAAHQAASDASSTGKLVVPATLPTSVDGTFQVMSKYYYKSSAGGVKIDSDYWRDVVATLPSAMYFANDRQYYIYGSASYSASVSDPSDMVRGLAAFCDRSSGVFPPGYTLAGSGGGNLGTDSWVFTVNYDISNYSASALSLDGIFTVSVGCYGSYWPSWYYLYPLAVDVLIDGQQVLTLSRGTANTIDFGGYVYSGSNNISIISFRWHMPFLYFVNDSSMYDGIYWYSLRSEVLSSAVNGLTISFLDGQDVINAQNNKAKDDINKHEEYESQWTGSMTENFNKLDVGNFTFHSGLIAGFAMVSGIFMDIWNAMGDAAVVYVFPLILGVVLMLLGRIGRTGGKRGSEDGEDTS